MTNFQIPGKTLLAVLALNLGPFAHAATTPSGPALPGGQASDVLSTISDPCIPWRIPCNLPEDAKVGKNEGFIAPPAGETWVQTPGGWNRCTETMCAVQSSTCEQNPSIPPCKAQKEREDREKAYDKMFPKERNLSMQNSLSLTSDSDGHGLDKNSGNLLGKAIANDAPKNQPAPSPSPFSTKSAGAGGGTAAGDWSAVDNAARSLSNVSDNGNSVSVGGPGGSAGAAPGGRSALGDIQGMRRQASISGQSDHTVWQDVVAWAQKFDLLGSERSNDPGIIDPAYRNTNTLGRRVDRRNAPKD